ncbi:MAG: hypothetical protein KGY60_12665, partial [Bacteroidales bacterium]|nr:hypothetical protein [Bacteroidales bacterium]
MKQLLLFIAIFTCTWQTGISQDTDSLLLENSEYIKKRINILLYRLNEMEQSTSSQLDSLQAVSSSSLKQIGRIETLANQQHQSLQDTLKSRSNNLQGFLTDINRQVRGTSVLSWVLFGLVTGMIILLLLLYLRERRRSIDYLIRRTEHI